MPTYKESLAFSENVLKARMERTKKIEAKIAKNKSYKNRTKSRESGLNRLKIELKKNKKSIEITKNVINRWKNLISGKWKDMYK
jgi:predicted secreted protein|tara:strand:- start:1059 stop:1310 length:252 start_codon:yes stop_codon:yes gene_type:complete